MGPAIGAVVAQAIEPVSTPGVSSRADLQALTVSRGPSQRTVLRPPHRWMTRIVLPLVLLAGFGGLMIWSSWDLLTPRLPVTVLSVVARKTVVEARGVELFTATGWVEPRPYPVEVPALAEGVVERLLVLPGQSVEANQVVAKLIDTDARLALDAVRQDLLERRLKVRSAQADLAEMEAQLRSSKVKVKVDQDLVREKLVSPVRLELTIAEQDVAEARVTQAKARLAETEARLQLALVAEQVAQLRLDRMKVRSPVAGIVMSVNTVPGRMVGVRNLAGNAPESLLTLHDADDLQVRVEVPLEKFQLVRPDQPASIEVDALPGQRLAGLVLYDTHETDIQRNTVRVKVGLVHIPGRVLNAPASLPVTSLPQVELLAITQGIRRWVHPQDYLRPGMIAKVRVQAPPTAGKDTGGEVLRIVIPNRLLVKEEGQIRVWLVDQGRNRAVLRPVAVGQTLANDRVEIVQGLQPSDKLITTSRELLRPDMRVVISGEDAVAAAR